MNIANRLTLMRVIMVPFFVLAMAFSHHLPALIIFGLASITDMFDGKVARKYNMVTDLGKFLDPLADKILVAAALICFVEMRYTAAWPVWIIIAREFMVSGVRLAAAGSPQKIVIAASIWGKLKTASTMIAICVILLLHSFADFGMALGFTQLISDILIYISTALTIISGAKYLWDYRAVFKS